MQSLDQSASASGSRYEAYPAADDIYEDSGVEALPGTAHSPRPSERTRGTRLLPYHSFEGHLKPALEATRDELMRAIEAIVEVEGPVVGARIVQAYVHAAGGSRAGKNIRSALNRAISASTRRGGILEDNPLGYQGIKDATYRLPSQPPVLERTLGPRDIHQVPPAELASVLRRLYENGMDQEACFRSLLLDYQLVRLTDNTRNTLQNAWDLMRRGSSSPA
jgi:hypothetical protein